MSRHWQSDGRCVGADPDMFFPARGAPTAPAKAVCASCPVREPCLDWGLRHEHHGIWGGLAERERRRLRRERAIAVTTPEAFVAMGIAACGTPAGYNRHRRQGTPVCQACREANSRARAGRRESERGAA